VSRRQLERLFKQHLDALPSRYYLELRLARARRLLMQTSQSILSIGLGCGFSSGPHFSSAYRQHFGITPREQRSPRAVQVASSQTALPVRAELVEATRPATTGSARTDSSLDTPG
jgi:transcriptional regulator GlxA family with amidase domain